MKVEHPNRTTSGSIDVISAGQARAGARRLRFGRVPVSAVLGDGKLEHGVLVPPVGRLLVRVRNA